MKNLVIACMVAVFVPAIAVAAYSAYVTLKEPEEKPPSNFIHLSQPGNLKPETSVYY